MNITTNERQVIDAILSWDGCIWTDVIQDHVTIEPKSIPGVVASLSKKGVVKCEHSGSESNVTLVDPERWYS